MMRECERPPAVATSRYVSPTLHLYDPEPPLARERLAEKTHVPTACPLGSRVHYGRASYFLRHDRFSRLNPTPELGGATPGGSTGTSTSEKLSEPH